MNHNNNHNKEDDPVNNGSGVWSEVVDISNSEDAQFDEHENYIEEDFITKDGVIHMKSPHRISSSENGNSSDTDTVATECTEDDDDIDINRLVYDTATSNALHTSSSKTVKDDETDASSEARFRRKKTIKADNDEDDVMSVRFQRAWNAKRGDCLIVIEDWHCTCADGSTVEKSHFEDDSSLEGGTTITDPTNNVTYTISVYKDSPTQPTGMSLMQCLKSYKDLKDLRKKFLVQVNSMNDTRLLQALTRLESKVPFPKAVRYMFYPTPALITAQQEALNKYFEALCLDDILMTSMGQLQHLIRS